MTTLARTVFAGIVAVTAFFCMAWLGCALIFGADPPRTACLALSIACAAAAGTAAWFVTLPGRPVVAASVMVGAFVTAAIVFVVGFFGPMIFAPDANQGPMLGLFGAPVGFLVGGLVGGIVGVVRVMRQRQR
ncbi:MAG: hypothetical protein KDC95_08895 [Planctomycetes bacterium]|nr:hypothetical protein [Planctomycetota bacterium]